MGETTCLTQPFSYTAGVSHQQKQGRNPVHDLGQSVSFGRFLSEPLEWERWSTFSHSKYVEEAEKFSRPGSVAQMKAFFEAHYKNLAARKAAEAANAAAAAALGMDSKNGSPENDEGAPLCCDVDGNRQINDIAEGQIGISDCAAISTKAEMVSYSSGVVDDHSDEGKIVLADTTNVEYRTNSEMDSEKEDGGALDICSDKQQEKPLLKDCDATRREELVKRKVAATPSTAPLSTTSRASKVSPSPAKLSVLLRNNSTTPVSKKSSIEPMSNDKRKQTPSSSRMAMNFTPVKEINRITSSIIRRLENSRGCSGGKVSQNCMTPMKTITELESFTTPQSGYRGTGTPLASSTSGGNGSRARWNFLPTDCSKFMGGRGNRTLSSVVSSPLNLKTEERAARRREKLEEKFNADQNKKMQIQATLMEKAEAELKKLRRSLCFKARPLPDFYKERARKDQTDKPLTTSPQSPQSDNHKKGSGQSGGFPRKGIVVKPAKTKSPHCQSPERWAAAATGCRSMQTPSKYRCKMGSGGKKKHKQDTTPLHCSKLGETRENMSPNILPLPV